MFALFHSLGTYLYEKWKSHNDSNWDTSYSSSLKSKKPKKFRVTEKYIKLSDGHVIGVDVYLPVSSSEVLEKPKYPTILSGTRYNRSFEVAWPFNWVVGKRLLTFPQLQELIPSFVSNGYAWVIFDARGTGASTGSRSFEWTPRDVQDVREIVQWVERQSFFNGKIGSMGISFDGLIATNIYGAPTDSIKACCSLFPPLYLFDDVLCPGGTFLTGLFELYSLFTNDLELNKINAKSSLLENPLVSKETVLKNGIQFALKYLIKGPSPVNGDRQTLQEALESRKTNYIGGQETDNMTFSDEPLKCFENVGCEKYVEEILKPVLAKKNTPMYIITSWYDTFLVSAVRLYLDLLGEHGEEHARKNLKLTIGPWSHAAMYNVSPFMEHKEKTGSFSLGLEMRRFFDYHLKGIDTGIANDKNVHFYAVGLEKWIEGDQYPVVSNEDRNSSRLHSMGFHEMECNYELESRSQRNSSSMLYAQYDIDYEICSSTRSRYNIVSQFIQNIDYSTMQKTHAQCLAFTKVITEDVLLDGRIRIVVNISVDHNDAVLFAYAVDVDPEGKWRYITEGHIRLIHRAGVQMGPSKRNRQWSDPRRTFKRKDSNSMVPYMPETVELFLLPISYRIKRGHSIRLVFAGADKYNFKTYRQIKSKWFRIYPNGSFVEFYELKI